ncbi:hypothetical protein NBRGN_098_01300 [Nocardia brasiliensis NBRC 14402]|nr:hypothetical protein NBRGN_098_01300 [Nocardia brasiliensis NBRC 14402]
MIRYDRDARLVCIVAKALMLSGFDGVSGRVADEGRSLSRPMGTSLFVGIDSRPE